MKKAYKWILAVVLTPLLLLFLTAALLYLPPIQDWAVRTVANYASDKTGMDISVNRVRLVFPLDLGVNGVKVTRSSSASAQTTDTIADVSDITVRVRLLPLLRKQVEIDELSLSEVKLNTFEFISNTQVRGRVGRLELESHGIDLGKETLRINRAILDDAQIDVALCDTAAKDTTQTAVNWKIDVDDLAVTKTALTVHLPGDTLQMGAYLGQAKASLCHIDLQNSVYNVGNFSLNEGKISYDNNFAPRTKGLDVNHIALSDIAISIDSLHYSGSALALALRNCAFKEKCGLNVTKLFGTIKYDTTKVVIPDLILKTSESSLSADIDLPLTAFSEQAKEKMFVSVDASVGKQDLLRLFSDIPPSLTKNLPNYPLKMKGVVSGNAKNANIDGLLLNLPTAFNVSAKGSLSNIMKPEQLGANIKLKAQTYNLDFVKALAGVDNVNIPHGITVSGDLKAKGKRYAADILATVGKGTVSLDANADLAAMKYNAQLKTSDLPLQQFLPDVGVKELSGDINVSGRGSDLYNKNTNIAATAAIECLNYDDYSLSDMTLTAELKDGKANIALQSKNEMVDGTVGLDALLKRNFIQTTLACDIEKVDLYRLHVTNNPLTTAVQANIGLVSDLKNSHKLRGTIKDIYIKDSTHTYHPENILLDVMTRVDSSYASIQSGDLDLRLTARCGYETLLSNFQSITEELKKQLDERYIDQLRIRQHMPELTLHVEAGDENFFRRAISRSGNYFRHAHVDMNTSPLSGINGKISIDSLTVSGVRLDTIRLALNSDSVKTDFDGQIRNGKNNPQYVFNALFRGAFYERGLYFGTRISDEQDRVGISFGLNAAMETGGLRLRLGGRSTPILGYKPFQINKDNYVFFGDDRHISANLQLEADDGMAVNVFTNDSTEALQDLTVGLMNFELSKILSIVPYVPNISGVMNGDFHVIQTTEELSVSSLVTVDELTYEGSRMGDITSEFVYIPRGDGSHFVDGTLACDDEEVGNLRGSYYPEGNGSIDAALTLNRTPLTLANGFIPDKLFNLRGYADGNLTVKGSLDAPMVDGELRFDSAYIASPSYGVELRFADVPIDVVKSHLVFDDFSMYASNKSPLSITGYYDFADLNNMFVDLRVRANNYLLIDSKENPRSEAYGKAYVNFFAMMNGSLESMKVRGRLDVLGSTDMTYILRDSPLTTDNQMDELVKFVNFKDTTTTLSVTRPPLTGMDIDLSLSIDEGAHIVCALNADHSNYVDLIGGGDLRLQYNVSDDIRLTGKYTLSNGEMKYSLPVIPLKTFTIQDGSYIEFNGDPMNPKLNITATEKTKSTVSVDGETSRTVEFECGVVITKTLQDMGLAFTIDAPEDMTVHNELQTMSTENRGKIAVTMLTTGMYLADGNTNSFSMNSALSAFLNSQISTISGNALRTLDLSFGMDNTTTSTGDTRTDYSFKFAKRFWNNRLSIVVGGKLSTGSEVENQNNTFFDNVTFEYRLSQNSNKYLKLFYERESYDWLEGNVGKYGAGFMWRRKLQHFKDIFRFKSTKMMPPQVKNDSIKTQKNDAEK